MKGIPVLPNGDPVRRTYVLAGDLRQFHNWCRFSEVNPRSRKITYVTDGRRLRGVNDFDLVYTGTWDSVRSGWRAAYEHIMDTIAWHRTMGDIKNTYSQYESYEIEPNIVGETDVRG